jgi:hypothetical protein
MPRELIEPHTGDKRYVRRKGGKFTKSQDDVGRATAADRRKKAKRVVKKGEGDRGDRKPASKSAKSKSAKKRAKKRAAKVRKKAPAKKSLLSRLLGR